MLPASFEWDDVGAWPAVAKHFAQDARGNVVRGRALVVKRLKPLPIEAVARGYLIGSGWKDYQASGSVCGIELPPGLQLAQQLPEPRPHLAARAASACRRATRASYISACSLPAMNFPLNGFTTAPS